MTAVNRSLSNRIGAYVMHSMYDARETTKAGRAKVRQNLEERLLAAIDEREPGLPDAERMRRLDYAIKAHFTRMQLASAKARSRNAGTA